MKRFLPLLAAFSLAAGPAAAQSPAPQPPSAPQPSITQPPAPQPPAATVSQPPERKPLNLRLDDASRHRIMSGASEDTGASKALPSLGGDARPLGTLRSNPFPQQSDNLQ
jgi:hypothetical protein